MARMLVVLAAALIVAAPAAAAPRLTLVHSQPFVVRGLGFKPHERVVVRAAARTVIVRTTSLGRFLATFTSDRCSGGRVVAVGASGDQAVLRLPPAMCAPP